jgi:hypothetical protein
VRGLEGLSVDKLADSAGRVDYDVGPRGVCLVHSEAVHCAGAIPTPRSEFQLSHVRVSPGEDGSACALERGGSLRCWGAGYTPSRKHGETVRIALAPVPFNADSAATDFGPTGPSCFVHRPCHAKRSLGRCAAGIAGPPTVVWSEEATAAERFTNKVVRVRGFMTTGEVFGTMVGCGEDDCCNNGSGRLVIAQSPNPGDGKASTLDLVLGNLACPADESRRCCDVVPNRQVVATGTLRRRSDEGFQSRWSLESPEICVLGGP